LLVLALVSLTPSLAPGGEITIYSSRGVESFTVAESPPSKATESYKRVGETCILNCEEQQGSRESSPSASREVPGKPANQNGPEKNVTVQIIINEPAVQYPVIPYWYAPPLRPLRPPRPPGGISLPPR